MSMFFHFTLLLTSALLLSSCGIGDQPCQPTEVSPADCASAGQVQVQAIMEKHCTSCHGETPVAGAPGGFRLDIYTKDAAGNLGTLEKEARVVFRSLKGDMPPGGGIDAADLKTLENWSACQCSEASP